VAERALHVLELPAPLQPVALGQLHVARDRGLQLGHEAAEVAVGLAIVLSLFRVRRTAKAVAAAEPDGYTILVNVVSDIITPILNKKAGYNLQTNFTPVGLLATAPNVLVVGPGNKVEVKRVKLGRGPAGQSIVEDGLPEGAMVITEGAQRARPGSVVAQGTGVSADTGSKPLLKVVPLDALQARVWIPNQAVGYVRPGLKADLSIDTYQASDFGYIPAKVISVGSDALNADEQKRVLGNEASGLYYPAMLRLERQNIKLITKQVPLQAGMSLTADIKLRERKFINIMMNFVENQRRNLERLR
jgi:hypothetical protein